MIDVIKQKFTKDMSVSDKLNVTREFLQILCLKIIHDAKMFNHLAFVGGTALRIVFGLKRFSEDLDFCLTGHKGYDFKILNSHLINSFELYGLTVETNPKTETNVHNTMLKFSKVLKELGLSALKGQKISIKLEIDTNPPPGWNVVNTIVSKDYTFNIVHYDLASLYAGKLHACFFRKFLKGRDWYDFVWYLGRRTKPNFILLNNAIEQTTKKEPRITEQNFKNFLLRGIEKIDFEYVKKDVERFLEDKNELSLFDSKIIRQTIEAVY